MSDEDWSEDTRPGFSKGHPGSESLRPANGELREQVEQLFGADAEIRNELRAIRGKLETLAVDVHTLSSEQNLARRDAKDTAHEQRSERQRDTRVLTLLIVIAHCLQLWLGHGGPHL